MKRGSDANKTNGGNGMMKKLPILLLMMVVAAWGCYAQGSLELRGSSFLPALNANRVANTSYLVTWNVGSVMGKVCKSDDGRITLTACPGANLKGLLATAQGATPVESEAMLPLTVRPNPASDCAIVTWRTQGIKGYSIEVYNVQGQLVRTATAHDGKAVLACSHLPNGLYLIRLAAPNGAPLGQTKMVVLH